MKLQSMMIVPQKTDSDERRYLDETEYDNDELDNAAEVGTRYYLPSHFGKEDFKMKIRILQKRLAMPRIFTTNAQQTVNLDKNRVHTFDVGRISQRSASKGTPQEELHC